MNVKLIIFDLDGVIVSTDEFHYRAWQRLSDELGLVFDRQLNNRLRGVSRKDSLDLILNHNHVECSPVIKEELLKKKNDYYLEQLPKLSPQDILPGVMEVLHEAKHKGILIAIGSSSKNARRILNQIGLSDTFDFIVDGNMIERGKPFPDVFAAASTHFMIDPIHCMVIEDARSGIDAAKRAGMIACAISDAYDYEKADLHLSSILELKQYMTKEVNQ